MYVVIRDLHGENLVSEVLSSLTKQLSPIVFHYIKNRVAILRTPHEVILAGTNRMCMTTILSHT